jgi:hypothetical protein
MPQQLRDLCYRKFEKVVAFGHRSELAWLAFLQYNPPQSNSQSIFRSQISHLDQSLFLKKAEIDQAIIRLPNCEPKLLEILAREHEILHSVQLSYGDRVHIRSARDFAQTHFSSWANCLQPWLYEPDQ